MATTPSIFPKPSSTLEWTRFTSAGKALIIREELSVPVADLLLLFGSPPEERQVWEEKQRSSDMSVLNLLTMQNSTWPGSAGGKRNMREKDDNGSKKNNKKI